MILPLKIQWWPIWWLLFAIITWLMLLNTNTNEVIITKTPHPFELGGKQIPIPKQEWITAGNAHEEQKLSNGIATIESRVLFKLEHNTVTAFILAHANATTVSNGWGISQDCKNPKHQFIAIFEHKDRNYKCSFVTDVFVAPQATAWIKAKTLATQHKWRVPSQWIIVGIRIADRLDVIDVRYGFNSHDITVQALVEWQKAALYWVERGFRRQLDFETPLPMPTSVSNTSASSMIAASRMYQLEKLRTADWLSATDFATQRDLIKQSIVTQADVTVDIWHLGALKTAGHTTQSLFWMWGVNYLFLGNVYIAGGLALAKSAISPIRYYMEEAAWNTWGPRRNPTLPVIDFM